jgi:hypothetical protein
VNRAARQEYAERYAAQSNRIIRLYLGDIFESLEWQADQSMRIIKDKGPAMAIGEISMMALNEKMVNTLEKLYINSGVFFANKGLREINAQAKKLNTKGANFGFSAEWMERIIAYFRDNVIYKAVSPITISYRNLILRVLEQASRENWGIDKIAAEIADPKMLLWRARMIARTENQLASNIGLKLAAEKSEYETGKEWIAANDHRTRHGHRRVDGNIVEEDGKFAVGVYTKRGVLLRTELMDGPGDHEASAANVINCRCTRALVPMRDERGRLIPKTTLLAA